MAFPVDVRSLRATYEIQYGHVERPTHANTSWDVARFEVCAHKWADLSEPGYGVALLNDCKYGYDISGNVIRLSLLRAPTWPDPVADRGHHRFTYRLLPHAGDLRDGRGHRRRLRPQRAPPDRPHLAAPGGSEPDGSLLSVDAANVVIEVVKRPDDGPDALVVRLYEAWGRRGPVTVRAPWELGRATLTDLLERELDELPVDGAEVALDISPFEIVTLLLEPAGPCTRAASRRRGSLSAGRIDQVEQRSAGELEHGLVVGLAPQIEQPDRQRITAVPHRPVVVEDGVDDQGGGIGR